MLTKPVMVQDGLMPRPNEHFLMGKGLGMKLEMRPKSIEKESGSSDEGGHIWRDNVSGWKWLLRGTKR